MKSYEIILRVKGKEDIFKNSEFTCYCRIQSTDTKHDVASDLKNKPSRLRSPKIVLF